MAVNIEQPRLLVVEGREEEVFFGALIRHLGLQGIQVMPIGGKTQLRQNLKALSLSSRFSQVISLGVVRDANSDPKGAFQSIKNALQSVKLPAPDRPLVVAGKKPRISVLILPEENTPGTLEDLCLRAVEKDPATSCVEEYFECLRACDLSIPDNLSKARVQVFLASRKKAGLRLGEASEAGYWPWDGQAFDEVRKFLQQICL
jgi:hypothetical protein